MALDSPSQVLAAIQERRSIRHFLDAPVDRKLIMQALHAASWAPSGLNNQPWRFALIWEDDLKQKLAGLTRYSSTLQGAAVLVLVFLDRESSYDYVKDCQAIGACIQNLLLTVHAQELGAVWIGEILKNKEKILKMMGLPDRLELMAVVAVGHPVHRNQSSHRRPLEELIVAER
ncbi:nitroreductase family protein [Desulfoferrobacter suflitae]|uniref:nitroreductase family protein n=1 Tax=Desulfoferrobacter suflitae TaxID=2865782 RepID=UPI002164E573|nr:nitroreductase [Desulfoferrobacter suflitae]MCK8603074.1 nitroreductase [Desulfoferrobacter suflitae]